MNLLIVDDHLINLKLLRAQLEAEGHVVFEAHDGVDALALLERQRMDVVISDVLMPRIDGYRLCHEIRKHTRLRDLPIIIYTSTYLSPGDEKLALDMGADKYLKKPVSVETLAAALHEVVAQPHAAPQPDAQREVEVLKNYNERLVSKLKEKNTELQAQTETLRESEEHYRGLFESSRDAIMTLEPPSWRFTRGNPATAEMFGVKNEEEFIVHGPWELSPERQPDGRASAEKAREMIEAAVRDGSQFFEWTHWRIGGEDFAADVLLTRIELGRKVILQATVRDITERKRAEEALRQCEERYRLLFERAPDVIFALTPTGAITSLNHAFETITGWPPAQWLGRPFQEIIHPDDQPRADELFQVVLRAGRVPTFELRVRTAAGGHRDVEFTGFSSQFSGGRIEVQGIGRDITERKQAEAALYQSESEQRNLVKSLTMAQEVGNVGSWETDLATQEVRWSEQTHRIFETTPDTFTPTHAGFLEFVHPDDREAVDTAFLASADSRAPGSIDHRIVIRDGRIKHIEERWQTFANAENHPVRAVGTCQDITERQLAERQLRVQNEILSNSHEGVMIVNLANEVSLWNRGAGEIFGWTAAEALGRPPDQLLGINELGVVSTLRAAVEREGFWNGDMRMQTRDGRKLIVDCRITLVRDEAGRPRARLAFLTDITEKKLLEGKFLRVQRLESIGTLAGGVAHDLNNALAPIMMGVELLKMQYPKESQIVNIFETSAKRGADMVRQLLTFAKGAEGERVLLRPGHLVKELEHLMKGSFPKNIQLVVKCDPNLPIVLGDATQLHQILLNLCVNARDAMPHGGTLTLEAQSMEVDAVYASSVPDAKPGKYVALRVCDTGTGIPPEILDRIFDPFFTTKGPDKGTGLGLSTVMGIVKGHGGFLQVYSQPGQGSTFTAYLPAADAGSDTEHVTKAAVEFRGQRETILLVDDEPAVRQVARAILRRLNFKPLTATDGADGLMQVAQHRTELRAIITDVHMPHMDGLAFVRALRRMLPDIPVMVVSGRMEDTVAGEFKTLGVTSRLDKPFTEVQLAEALKNLLAPK